MSGAEVCKQLRADRSQTPIIVLSAVREEIDKVLLLEIGADDYVVKPVDERLSIEERRTAEQAQTKVEAAHKLPI